MTFGDNTFHISIENVEASNFKINVSSPAGEATDYFELDFDVEDIINNVINSRFSNNILKENGEILFNLIFKNQILELFKLNKSNLKGNESLNIRLEFESDATNIAKLPWELIYDGSQFLVSSGKISLIRYIKNSENTHLNINIPLRILVIISRPLKDILDPLIERESIIRGLFSLQDKNDVIIDILNPPTLSSLIKAISTKEYQVIHFDGHGSFEDDMGYLLFEDENMGYAPINSEIISNTLSSTDIKLVVLTACESSKLGNDNMFSSVAPSLIQAGIPAVIAMQFSVPLSSAAKFVEHFYNSLAHYNSISKSVIDGRKAIYADRTWFMPTLYLSNIDLVLKASERSEKFETNLYSSINEQYYDPFFVGREKNLVEISNSIASTRTNCTVIWGSGGIGKTALLRRYVLRQNWRFHGEVIWINLRGGKSLSEIHKNIGEYLGLNIESNKNLESDILKSLSKNSYLIVFDNYEDVEKDEKILNYIKIIPRPTRIVITTRNSPSIIVWKKIKLYKLSLNESVELFCKLSEDLNINYDSYNSNLIIQICKIVDGHPLALILIVKMLESNSISTILSKIKESSLKGIELALDVSYDGLKDVEKLMIQRLSVFISEFDEEAVQSVSDLDSYEDIKDELIRRSFIYFDGRKFIIHPIIKQYAYNKLNNKKKYQLAAAKYYKNRNTLRMIDHLYLAGEYYQVVNIMRKLIQPLVLSRSLSLDGVIGRIQLLLNSVDMLNDDKLRCSILQEISYLCEYTGLKELSKKYNDDAYDLADKIDFFEVKFDTLLTRSHWSAYYGNIDALELAKELKNLADGKDDPHYIFMSLGACAVVYQRLGNYHKNNDFLKQSLSKYTEAIKLGEKIAEGINLATPYHNLGQIYFEFKDYNNAIMYLNESLSLRESFGDYFGSIKSLGSLCEVYVQKEMFQEARDCLNDIIFLREKVYIVNYYEKIYFRLGEISIILGEDDQAAKAFGKAIQCAIVSWDDYLSIITSKIENEIESLFEKNESERALYIIRNLIDYLNSKNLTEKVPDFVSKVLAMI